MNKFCKDCVFSSTDNKFAQCYFFKPIGTKKTDDIFLVTGKIKKQNLKYSYCSAMRSGIYCGTEGSYFVPITDKNHFEYGMKSYWSLCKKIRVLFTVYLRGLFTKKSKKV